MNRSVNWKALQNLHRANRFRLMFGQPLLPETISPMPPIRPMYQILKPIYNNHIIKAEIAVMAACEIKDPIHQDEEIAIAIGQLELAVTQLKKLREKQSSNHTR